jgi:hypothetical protein
MFLSYLLLDIQVSNATLHVNCTLNLLQTGILIFKIAQVVSLFCCIKVKATFLGKKKTQNYNNVILLYQMRHQQ